MNASADPLRFPDHQLGLASSLRLADSLAVEFAGGTRPSVRVAVKRSN
jgi:hypothetical protein